MNLPQLSRLATAAFLVCVGGGTIFGQQPVPKVPQVPLKPESDKTLITGPVTRATWGKTKAGEVVDLFTLTSSLGIRARIATYGALLVSLETPDREGVANDITISYPDLAAAEQGGLNGNVVGRFANRIDTGGFTIDGKRHDLETVNQKTNVHIHGGKQGIQRQVWEGKPIEGNDWIGVRLEHTSPDSHEGFPGEVKFIVEYRLDDDSLTIDYKATTTKPTHLNLTNHAYFNLSGEPGTSISDHVLELKAEHILAIDDRKIPTGKYLPVKGTPFDFLKGKPIADQIHDVEGGGYDHCFVLNKQGSLAEPTLFGRITDPKSGRVMEILTTQPGCQIYTANHYKDPKWPAICFETQHFPDAPNKPNFPSTLLKPGEEFREVTVFQFGIAK
ncbi:MAG: galactose mutarotase [Verrucomicrobiales bacterium]|nr:galactose mutarotase [Verrucomicrobiales bacterium]